MHLKDIPDAFTGSDWEAGYKKHLRNDATLLRPKLYRETKYVTFGDLSFQTLRHHDYGNDEYYTLEARSISLTKEPRHFELPSVEPPCDLSESLNLDRLLKDTSSLSEPQLYLIGEAHTQDQRKQIGFSETPLSTSPRLLETAKHYAGIHTSYYYISIGQTCSTFHKEDANLWSANLLRYGRPKIWIIIPPKFTVAFESHIARIRRVRPGHVCDQFVRHTSTIVSLQTLKKLGIQYRVEVQKKGETIYTARCVYHAVYNVGYNEAEAINFCPSEWLVPPLYRFCSKTTKCGSGPFVNLTGMTLTSRTDLTIKSAHVPQIVDQRFIISVRDLIQESQSSFSSSMIQPLSPFSTTDSSQSSSSSLILAFSCQRSSSLTTDSRSPLPSLPVSSRHSSITSSPPLLAQPLADTSMRNNTLTVKETKSARRGLRNPISQAEITLIARSVATVKALSGLYGVVNCFEQYGIPTMITSNEPAAIYKALERQEKIADFMVYYRRLSLSAFYDSYQKVVAQLLKEKRGGRPKKHLAMKHFTELCIEGASSKDKSRIKNRIKAGKRWARLAQTFGECILVLLPQSPGRDTQIEQKFSDSDLNAFIQAIQKYRGHVISLFRKATIQQLKTLPKFDTIDDEGISRLLTK